LARSAKRSGADARRAKKSGGKQSTGASETASPPRPPRPPRDPAWALTPMLRDLGLANVAAILAFLGFAGFGIWPLAFVAYVPLFFVLDRAKTTRGWRALAFGGYFGFFAQWGGYYWLVEMLDHFSGFSWPICVLFASILIAYTAGGFVVFSVVWAKATGRGWSPTLAAVAAFLASELVYPLLFPYYYGASFHTVPVLMQTADLGGPLMQSALAILVNVGVFEVTRALLRKERVPRAGPVAAAAFALFTVAYGLYRIDAVDAEVAAAPKVLVATVQSNMGLIEKDADPVEGHRRHLEQSLELERTIHPDLIVWPESAYNEYFLPPDIRNVKRAVLGRLETPLLFGGMQARYEGERQRHFNTAFITNGEGDLLGSYDKTYLLAFGEYIPFGDVFPQVYDISRHSGHFSAGSHVHALPFRDFRISTLICYEDILNGFVRRAVRESHPHLLVNITNDAWFGDTQEPWIHLALAESRAVEHHRYLVRATNSGVSAIIDPVGRVVTHSGTFRRQNLSARVAMLDHATLYEWLGDWPGWLAVIASLWMLWRAPGRFWRAGRQS